jgi:hypothetical protein
MSTPKAAEGPDKVLTKPILTLSAAQAGVAAKAAKTEAVNKLLITGKRMNDSWQNCQKKKKSPKGERSQFCAEIHPLINGGLPFSKAHHAERQSHRQGQAISLRSP